MRSLIVSIVVVLLAMSCEKEDKFDGVVPVTAPVASATNAGVVAAPVGEMPEGHPPVGGDSPIAKPAVVQFASPAEYGTSGPLRWTAPATWRASKPASSMRLAEYIVPGQPEAAVLSIFYFGPSGGGGVDANVSRWVGQFDDGKASPKRGQEQVNGMAVHTVDVSGTYNAGMAGGGAPPKGGTRMLGAIVESDAGLFFFKLVGPADVVAAEEPGWAAFVASFTKG